MEDYANMELYRDELEEMNRSQIVRELRAIDARPPGRWSWRALRGASIVTIDGKDGRMTKANLIDVALQYYGANEEEEE
jgi:hypothetical protein